jgi:hypothetical protein
MIMQQSSEKPQRDHTTPDKGLAYYPITDMQFDVINVIAEKCKALQAYDQYIRDAKPNGELLKVLEGIKADDRRHVEELRKYLGSC